MQKEYCPYKSIRYVNIILLRKERVKRWQVAVSRMDKEIILAKDLGERINCCRNQSV